MICKICNNFESNNLQSVVNHLLRTHKITPKFYYDTYETITNCMICNSPTKFVNCFDGYKKLCKSYSCNGEYRKKSNTFIIKYRGHRPVNDEPCPICNKIFKNAAAITSHFQHNHSDYRVEGELISKTIYDIFKKKPDEDKCIQCGGLVKFSSYINGYKFTYCSPSCARIYELKTGVSLNRVGRWKFKKYIFPSGKIVNVQGFEPKCLDFLIASGIDEYDITTCGKDHPIITYDNNGIIKRYYPDIFIKSLNLIVEVKCTGTYLEDFDVNQLKRNFSIAAGYNFEFVIDHDFTILETIIKSENYANNLDRKISSTDT